MGPSCGTAEEKETTGREQGASAATLTSRTIKDNSQNRKKFAVMLQKRLETQACKDDRKGRAISGRGVESGKVVNEAVVLLVFVHQPIF